MKARLTKNLKVKSVTTYLVIEKEQERKDIQQFLNGNKFHNEIINERVREYLRKLRVLDENNIPTQKGNEIKKTGKMFAKEEGKYKIWYIERDNFIGNKILFIKRAAPRNDIKNLETLKTKLDKETHFCLPTQQNDFFRFNLIDSNSEKPYEPDNNQYGITLTWVWDNLEKSFLIFEGNLSISPNEKNKSDIVIKTMNLSFEDNFRGNLRDFIKEIFTDWDTKTERLKIRFQELDNHEKETFEKNISIQNGWNGFDIKFEKIPLIPYDEQEAEKWRNWLVTQELEKEYFNRNDFSELVKEINQKPALEPFYLSSIEPYEFLKIIGKSKNPKPYWHLMATLDLNPNKDVLKSYSKMVVV
jgi:hypothetical protein